MADQTPVRVRTTVTANPPLQGVQIPPTVSSVIDPDDLARAIREGVDARLRDVVKALSRHQDLCMRTIGVFNASYIGAAILNMLDAAPREPAQEQFAENAKRSAERAAGFAEGVEAAAKAALAAGLPDGYDWGRDAMEQFDFGKERAAVAIRALTPPTPDPLLSGQDDAVGDAAAAMREVADYLEAAGGVGAAERVDVLRRAATVVDEVNAEIARRDSGDAAQTEAVNALRREWGPR